MNTTNTKQAEPYILGDRVFFQNTAHPAGDPGIITGIEKTPGGYCYFIQSANTGTLYTAGKNLTLLARPRTHRGRTPTARKLATQAAEFRDIFLNGPDSKTRREYGDKMDFTNSLLSYLCRHV